MKIIGLTGGIASGKTTVSKMFQEKGLKVIDLDELARIVVQPKKKAYKEIVKYFGKEILKNETFGNEIDREKLGEIIFQNSEARKKLNSFTHFPIFIELLKRLFFYWIKGVDIVIIDSPLLFETNLQKLTSKNIVVWTDLFSQLERLKLRNHYDDKEAKNRIESQMNLDKKKELADYIIDNSKDIQYTQQQVNNLILTLKSNNNNYNLFFKITLSLSFCLFSFYFYKIFIK